MNDLHVNYIIKRKGGAVMKFFVPPCPLKEGVTLSLTEKLGSLSFCVKLSARNVGVLFDHDLNFDSKASSVVQS